MDPKRISFRKGNPSAGADTVRSPVDDMLSKRERWHPEAPKRLKSRRPWWLEDEDPRNSEREVYQIANPPKYLPKPAPKGLPRQLEQLHGHLTSSPFLLYDTITYIDAKQADPDAYVHWVVLATMRPDREGAIRSAIGGLKKFLTNRPISFGDDAAPPPYAPKANDPRIGGLINRAVPVKGETTDWALVDCGDVVVHYMTEAARQQYDIEGLWERISRKQAIDEPKTRELEAELEAEEESESKVFISASEVDAGLESEQLDPNEPTMQTETTSVDDQEDTSADSVGAHEDNAAEPAETEEQQRSAATV